MQTLFDDNWYEREMHVSEIYTCRYIFFFYGHISDWYGVTVNLNLKYNNIGTKTDIFIRLFYDTVSTGKFM